MIRPEAPVWNCSRCGVAPFLELFNIRRCPVDTQIARKFVDLGVEQEWPGLVRLVLSERENIETTSERRNGLMLRREKKIRELIGTPTIANLTDVFKIIPKDTFPSTWKFVLRILSIMPTTVSCEQTFSYYKRTIHTNMGEKTAKSFLFARLNLYETSYNL